MGDPRTTSASLPRVFNHRFSSRCGGRRSVLRQPAVWDSQADITPFEQMTLEEQGAATGEMDGDLRATLCEKTLNAAVVTALAEARVTESADFVDGLWQHQSVRKQAHAQTQDLLAVNRSGTSTTRMPRNLWRRTTRYTEPIKSFSWLHASQQKTANSLPKSFLREKKRLRDAFPIDPSLNRRDVKRGRSTTTREDEVRNRELHCPAVHVRAAREEEGSEQNLETWSGW